MAEHDFDNPDVLALCASCARPAEQHANFRRDYIWTHQGWHKRPKIKQEAR